MMKRPKNMTMQELIELPILADKDELNQFSDTEYSTTGYGGAFRDDDGFVWGTLKLHSGWVRYPAYLSVLN